MCIPPELFSFRPTGVAIYNGKREPHDQIPKYSVCTALLGYRRVDDQRGELKRKFEERKQIEVPQALGLGLGKHAGTWPSILSVVARHRNRPERRYPSPNEVAEDLVGSICKTPQRIATGVILERF